VRAAKIRLSSICLRVGKMFCRVRRCSSFLQSLLLGRPGHYIDADRDEVRFGGQRQRVNQRHGLSGGRRRATNHREDSFSTMPLRLFTNSAFRPHTAKSRFQINHASV